MIYKALSDCLVPCVVVYSKAQVHVLVFAWLIISLGLKTFVSLLLKVKSGHPRKRVGPHPGTVEFPPMSPSPRVEMSTTLCLVEQADALSLRLKMMQCDVLCSVMDDWK